MKKGPHNMMSVTNYGHVYVKFIDYVANHPKCTWKDINSHVHPGKPLYTSRTEFIDLCPKYVAKVEKSGSSFLYEVTADGLQMIEDAKKTKWLFDFISAVKKSGSKTLDEFDVNMTLFGDRRWVDPRFLKSVGEACWNDGRGFNSNCNAYGNFLSRKLQWGECSS